MDPATTMKVGLVRRGYSSSGGAESYLQRFADGLAAAGHQPVLFTSQAWPAEKWPYELRLVGDSRSPAGFARALAALEPSRACDFLLSLERVLACDCYRAGDGVHAAWLERRARTENFLKPLIRGWQPKHREILALERAMFQEGTATQVIANSHMVKDEIVRCYGYPAEKIKVIYNGVPRPSDPETSARLRAEVRRELDVSDHAYVLLFAGSGWERKGLRTAIRGLNSAAGETPLVLVAGRGNPRSMPASPHVRYLGPVPGLTRWLAASDVFLLPTQYDPFSNACLEARVAGLPVITTTANGFSEIVTTEDGTVLADAEDARSVASAIEHWSSSARRLVAKERLSTVAKEFSVERNVREILATITD